MNLPKVIETDDVSFIWPYLREHGSSCMAYSSVQQGISYLIVEGIGYVPYIKFKHWFWSWKERSIVLANPICKVEDYKLLLSMFLDKKPDSMFVQINHDVADALNDSGYQVNQFGVETEVSLDNYSLVGKAYSKLRQWRNKCQREGVEIFEKPIDEMSNESADELNALSKAWLKSKGGNELSFLTRPFVPTPEKDVKYFWAYQNQKLVGFAVFDPVYNNNEIIGYYHNVDRISDYAPNGVSAAIMIKACEIFSKDGKQFVSLGMSPLYKLGKAFNYNEFTRTALRFAFKKLEFIYPFSGNANHKNKFNREKMPVYFSSTRGNKLWEVFVLMKAMGFY